MAEEREEEEQRPAAQDLRRALEEQRRAQDDQGLVERYGFRTSLREALQSAADQHETGTPVPEPVENTTEKRFSPTDIVVLVVGECLAVPFCIAGGEAFVMSHYPEAAVGFGAGIPLAIAAATFSFWKARLGVAARDAVTRYAMWWLPAAVILAYAYVVVPDIYRRTAPPEPPTTDPKKSTYLSLDESQKWHFSSTLRDSAIAQNGERLSCKYISQTSLVSSRRYADGASGELQQMLDLAGWANPTTLVGPINRPNVAYPPGFTILVGVDKGPSFICASAAGQELQNALSSKIPVQVRTNQVTPILSACENNCVEIDIGDFDAK